LVRQMPEGVYIRSLKQDGVTISMVGYAQSNARVSALMRNIEASPWLEKPLLIEIKAVVLDKRRLNEFSLNARLKREAIVEGGGK
jgi:type IV pilus assembly protein PilN